MTFHRPIVRGLKVSFAFLCFAFLGSVFAVAVTPKKVLIDTVAVRYLAPEELGDISKVIVHARIDSVVPERKGNMVYTVARCKVVELLRGELSGAEFEIRQPGGTLEGVHTWSGPIPKWETGQEWIFALSSSLKGRWSVVGIKQGAFLIIGDTAEREYEGFSFVDKPPSSVVEMKESIPVVVLKQRLLGESMFSQPTPSDGQSSEAENFTLDRKNDQLAIAGENETALPDQQSTSLSPVVDVAINRLPTLLIVISCVVLVGILMFLIRREKRD